MKHSLRLRLLLSTSLTSAIILGLLGFSIYGFMWKLLSSEFDAGMLSKAKSIASMVEQHGPIVTFDADLEQMPEFSSTRRPEYFEVWLDGGNLISKSASMGNKDLLRPSVTPNPVFDDTAMPDGHYGRRLTFSFPPRLEHDEDDIGKPTPARMAVLIVEARPAELHHTLEMLRWLLLTLCGTALIASGIVQYRVVGWEIRPVNRLAAEIGALRETQLSRRLLSSDVPSELQPVVDKLNGLLERLEESFGREKSFTADVAHELRTPLAGLATTLEVCRSRPRDQAAYESAIDDCQAMTDRMRGMVESLLLLARADAGQLRVSSRSVDLRSFLDECWLPFESRAAVRGLTVTRELPDKCTISTDADKLRIVLNNLFDNAISYTNDNGSIRIAIRTGAVTTVEISNTGNQINPADMSRLFERFYRGDQARSDTGIHCGLGLSLCQRLMRLLGGQITANTTQDQWFVATLTLPV